MTDINMLIFGIILILVVTVFLFNYLSYHLEKTNRALEDLKVKLRYSDHINDELRKIIEVKDKQINTDLSKHQKDIELIKELFEIGVDVHIPKYNTYNPSWAVICINGKSEYVKFLELGEIELRHLRQFLSNFERSRVTLDVPQGAKRYFI